ncbi:MAG: hypothetical protein ACP5JP_08415, partial [bacterium]
VATTKRKYNGKVYTTYLLRRSYRDGNKVKHETLGNISHLPLHVIKMIQSALKGETMVKVDEAFEVVRNLPHGHVAACVGTIKKLGLDEIIYSKRTRERDLVIGMIVSRIIQLVCEPTKDVLFWFIFILV